MKKFTVISVTEYWSQKALTRKIENILNRKTLEGYEVYSVQINYGMYAYITLTK